MERRHLIDRVIKLFPPGSLVDLGSGHGGYAMRAARLGWKATAVDARTERFPEHRPSSVTWVQCDVREFDVNRFDLVLCLGLFYHLTVDDQIALLDGCRRPLIIDTHVDHGTHVHPLSDRVTLRSYEGRLYAEPGKATSSWGNDESFWPTLDSFYRMLHDCGFSVVLTADPWIADDRLVVIALP